MSKFKPNLQRFTEVERALIMRADAFAERAHAGQKRKSGLPYIVHPREVAQYLLELDVDADTVVAGLLHDTVEDTDVTPEQIEQEFGPDVGVLVEGVTKLGEIDYVEAQDVSEVRHATSVENLRKLLLAMSKDLRVLIIKLADRRHNLMTLDALKPADQVRIARESLEVFAPLADRLGMGVLKAELEDMAFKYADPAAYRLVRRLSAQNAIHAQDYIEELKREVRKLLKAHHVEVVSVHGRQKHLYSVYRKLNKTEGDITKIYDLMALRVIVPEISDCYQVLGILHQQYKPLIYRIKDYIAVPKPNGYRSLHTTVFAKHGNIIEIQIRTPRMHKEAEQGLAAHSIYNVHKDTRFYRRGEGANVKASRKLSWIQEVAGLSAQNEDGLELMDQLKIDLFRDRIFVFSPKGDLYDLPEGATPVDFAFAVHTDIGLRTQGARVNNRIAPLDRPLENRDVVDIITRKQAAPNRQWLGFVKTAGARSRIKAWFRAASRDANIVTGRQMLEAQLPTWGYKRVEEVEESLMRATLESFNMKDIDTLLAAIGEGSVALTTVLRRLMPQVASSPTQPENYVKKTTGRMQVVGAPELPCYPALCCQPEPPVPLIGYITRGSGVTVHRADCANVPDEPERLLDCQWEIESENGALIGVTLQLVCRNRMGVVHDITGQILSRRINIVRITSENVADQPNRSLLTIMLEVEDLFVLNALTQQLHDMYDVQKITPTVVGVRSVEEGE